MSTERILALDLCNISVGLPPHGNRWEWFTDRKIEVVKIYGSRPPVGMDDIRVLPSISALARYADSLGVTDRKNVIYVSDNKMALRCAREIEHFSTIAISPASAELGDCASTSCATTADLAGLVNLLNQKLWPTSIPAIDAASTPPSSDK